MGEPLPDDELMALADLTPDDVEQAKARWREDAPPGFEDLLDAERA